MSKFYLSGRNQTKTVTPSNIQQTVSPDIGYNALNSVVVNPIKAAMPQTLEQYIMRDDNMEPFLLNLDGDVPAYACYHQSKLVAVYGTLTAINNQAFTGCVNLEEIESSNVTSIGSYVVSYCTKLKSIDFRSLISVPASGLRALSSSDIAIDLRNVQNIGNNNFFEYNAGMSLLVDITNSHSAVLDGGNANLSIDNCIILVADATDKAYYQSATNWSAHASKIKTVAEFEQQIGMSYDVYYEIIFGHPRFDTEEEQP